MVAKGKIISMRLALKLASLAVHTQEATGPTGHQLDLVAMKGLAWDPDVINFLSEFDPVLLPKQR